MNIKKAIQIAILFLIFGILYFFFVTYFKNDPIEKKTNIEKLENNKNSNSVSDEKTDYDSLITDLKYYNTDKKGNIFSIESEFAETDLENENIINLRKVSAIIELKNESKIMINSEYAVFDKITLNTKFSEEVRVVYKENFIICDNFDLFFENNKGTLYNNLIFENDVSKMLADSVEFNLLTGDTEVKMFNSENKVKIIKK